MSDPESDKPFMMGYDPLVEEYWIEGPDNFSCHFIGRDRQDNASFVLKVLNELYWSPTDE